MAQMARSILLAMLTTKINSYPLIFTPIPLMKPWIAISLLGAFTASAKPPMRDAVTHDQLSLQYRKAAQEDPMRKLEAVKRPDPVKGSAPAKTADPAKAAETKEAEAPPSLLAQSDIICFNGLATLVPKRAIIQIPKNLAGRLGYQPGAKLVGWGAFYALNRGWITTVEVDQTQAEGNSPLAEETHKKIVKSGNMFVATFQGGPISMLPLKVPVEETSPSNPNPKS